MHGQNHIKSLNRVYSSTEYESEDFRFQPVSPWTKYILYLSNKMYSGNQFLWL